MKRTIEKIILQSHWLTVPFLLGLIIRLAALLYTVAAEIGGSQRAMTDARTPSSQASASPPALSSICVNEFLSLMACHQQDGTHKNC